MIIKNASVFGEDGRFEKKDIYIEGERFSNHGTGEILDAEGCLAIPGLTDIHFHGCDGVDFCDGSLDAIRRITAYEAAQGITTVVPATMTLDKQELLQIAETAASYRREENLTEKRAELFGINMEGPFVSREKCGAQNPRFLHKPDIEMFLEIMEASAGSIRLCDVAPEEPGALDFIEEAASHCRISVAHTTADYETAREAFERGASHVTHLYNAMPPFLHRAPGPIGAAAENDEVVVELICDGIHVDPCAVRTTFRLFGKERIALISDSMMATGLPDGEYALGGQAVTVVGKKATLHDGTIAGSVTNLMNCMKNAVLNMGIPLEEAVYSAAVTPAKAVGCYDHVGSITPGKFANLILLDQDSLRTSRVFVRGR